MKKFIYLIIVTSILVLIPTIFFISHKSNAKALYDLKIKSLIEKIINKETDSIKPVDIRLRISQELSNCVKRLYKATKYIASSKQKFWSKCKIICNKTISDFGLETEIGFVLKYNGKYLQNYYGKDLGASTILKELANITAIQDLTLNEIDIAALEAKLEIDEEKEINLKVRKVFNTNIAYKAIRNTATRLRSAYSRQKNSLRQIFLHKYKNKLLISANVNLTNVNQQYYVKYKTKSWTDKNFDLCLVNKKNKKTFYAKGFTKNVIIRNWIKHSPHVNSNKSIHFIVSNHIIRLTDFPNSDFKHILVCKLPNKDLLYNSKNTTYLLTLLSLLSCVIFKIFVEKLFFYRGSDVSLQIIVFCGFIIIVVIPLSALVYLTSQYSLLKFTNEKASIENKLAEKLHKYDRKVLRQYRNRLNLLRSFNSIKKIAEYSNSSNKASLESLSQNFVKTLTKNYKNQICSEIWFYTPKHGSTYYRHQEQSKTFVVEDPPDFFKILLKNRFDRILNTKSIINKSKIDTVQLKQEMAKDIILSMFGHQAYYKLNDSNDNYIELSSKDNDHSMMTVKVASEDNNPGIICWMQGSRSSGLGNLPEGLTIASSAPLIVLAGIRTPYITRPKAYDVCFKNIPDVLKASEYAQLYKRSVKTEINKNYQTAIIEAMPAKNANITIAGKMILPSFQEKRTSINKIVSRNAKILVVFALILSILSAWYFIVPIRNLTRAIRSITKRDYSVRINAKQPDEFGTIFTHFNDMAKGLEEGKLLKKFVSTSIEEEVKKNNNLEHSSNAQIKQTTILFSGIISFDKILGENNPQIIFQTLQKHLSASVTAIKGINGEIDKMIEDKIMIVFESDNHALNAINAAREIKQELKKSNIHVGIGVNSGKVVSGIMGASEVRLAKTVIGDPVNLSARLASIALKNKNSSIIISGKTLQQLPTSFHATKLEIDKVKGKTQTIEAYLLNESET